jgi:hypothetical protein
VLIVVGEEGDGASRISSRSNLSNDVKECVSFLLRLLCHSFAWFPLKGQSFRSLRRKCVCQARQNVKVFDVSWAIAVPKLSGFECESERIYMSI